MIRKATMQDIDAVAQIYEAVHDAEEAGALCIGYALRPDLSSRLTWSGRTFLQKPEVSGHVDSHHIRATHSGILTSVNSTAAFATVSPLTQRSPTPHLTMQPKLRFVS